MINTFTGSLLLLWWINPPVRRQIKSASLNQTKMTDTQQMMSVPHF